jgi:hypothetical protein
MSKSKRKTHYDINTIDCYISEAQDSRDNATNQVAKDYHSKRIQSLYKIKTEMGVNQTPVPAMYFKQVQVIDRACVAAIHGQAVLNY